jgi:polysaccharide export outer membrane protein
MKGFRRAYIIVVMLGALGWARSAAQEEERVGATGLDDRAVDAGGAEVRGAVAGKNHLADPNYELQPDDVLEIAVFREPDLTTDGMVRKDGSFDMKLLGAVKVAGLTADQAAELVRAALAKDYLVNPEVTVGIVDYARKKINILGEVRAPGVYSFPARGPLLLSDAVALAGGFLPTADPVHVAVRRVENGREVSLDVDGSAKGDGAFELRPDDALAVAAVAKLHFTMLGQINRPGSYDFPENRPIYLTDAIALAGGFTRIADSSHVLLKREEEGRETVRELNAKAMANSPDTERVELSDGDTITVPENLF